MMHTTGMAQRRPHCVNAAFFPLPRHAGAALRIGLDAAPWLALSAARSPASAGRQRADAPAAPLPAGVPLHPRRG